MNRSMLLSVGSVAVLVTMAACAAEKSSNPLSPTVAGPIPGVNITAPSLVQPSSGTRVAVDSQPVMLMVRNATTSGVRPLSYRFEVATDPEFANKVFARDGIAPNESGQTGVRLPDPLGPERSYFWRARAEDGANTGPFSTPVDFVVYTPIVFQPPVPLAPVNNATVGKRPRFLFANAARTGPAGPVTYLVELSDSDSFANVASATVGEQGGQTGIDSPTDLPVGKQMFWRVRASEATTTGPWSSTAVFRTEASGGGGGGGGGGCPVTNEQWREYVFGIIAQRGLGANVNQDALYNMRPDVERCGAQWQHDSGGVLRPRLFLPNGADTFGRPVDMGDYGSPWRWVPR